MSDEIITFLFAIIAGIVLFRLRAALGRRTGSERERANPLARLPAILAPAPVAGKLSAAADPLLDPGPRPLAVGLAELKRVDARFNESEFLGGARAAFALIVEAFVRNDAAALRPLLADAVFHDFSAAISARQAAGESLELRIEKLISADLSDVRVDGPTAAVTVTFVSEQLKIVRDRAGEVIDGDRDHAHEVVDFWTFARETASPDPNWRLVATRNP